MQTCASCGNPLSPLTEWKGSDSRFYCSEFCADAGETETSAQTRSNTAAVGITAVVSAA
jgi:hypothetical protein